MFDGDGAAWSVSVYTPASHRRRVLLLTLLLGFVLYGGFSCYHYFVTRQQVQSGEVNTQCLRDNVQQRPHYCDIPGEQRFSKVLMLVTDAWPLRYADLVIDHYRPHSAVYHIDVPGSKFSHAIYTSYMTGQPPTNYKGEPIRGDNIVAAMHRAGGWKLRYYGPEWSFLAVLGSDNYDRYFTEVNLISEPLDTPYQHAYPFFFEAVENKQFLHQVLQEVVERDESVIAHTGVFDHRQHGEHRFLGATGRLFPRTDAMARLMNSDIKSLKSFIDENPDYLLVLLSDHGVDSYGLTGYKLHGDTEDGNEGFLLLYNPNLPPLPPKRIDVVDVCPTLAMYLRGVDIPYDSLGTAATNYHQGDSSSRLLILQVLFKDRGESAEAFEALVKRNSLLHSKIWHSSSTPLVSEGDTEAAVQEIEAFASALKARMYSSMQIPWGTIALYSVLCMALTLGGLLQYNFGLEYYVKRDDMVGFAWNVALAFGLYTPALIQILWCWWGWRAIHNAGHVPQYMGPVYALVILRCMTEVRRTLGFPRPLKRNGNPYRERDSVRWVPTYGRFEKMVFINEAINVVILFYRITLPDAVAVLELIPGKRFIWMAAFTAFMPAFYHMMVYPQAAREKKRGGGRSAKCHRFLNVLAAAFRRSEVVAGLGCMLLIEMYQLTQAWVGMYFVGEFHVCAAAALVVAGVVLPVYLLWKNRMAEVGVWLVLVLALLERESVFKRLLMLGTLIQWMWVLQPLVRGARSLMGRTLATPLHLNSLASLNTAGVGVSKLLGSGALSGEEHAGVEGALVKGEGEDASDMSAAVDVESPLIPSPAKEPMAGGGETEKLAGGRLFARQPHMSSPPTPLVGERQLPMVTTPDRRELPLRGPLHPMATLLFQAVVLYCFNQAHFTLVFGFNDRINLDVHPFAGGAGRLDYNNNPYLSAAFMVFHKYGIFVVLTLLLWTFMQQRVTIGRGLFIPPNVGVCVSRYLSDYVILVLLLYWGCVSMGYYLMAVVFSKDHGFHEGTAALGLYATLAGLYVLLSLVGTLRRNDGPRIATPSGQSW